MLIGLSLTVCPLRMKNGPSEPPTTKTGFIPAWVKNFLPGASCVYYWVSGAIFLWWIVDELN